MKNLLLCVLGLSALLNVGCSTIQHHEMDETAVGVGGTYQDSALANPNPAPKSLTPPDYAPSGANPVMDGAYLSSQADYHYTMGETMSFEGQTQKAIEEFKTTLIYDPKSVQVHLSLAREYTRAGMITEAVEQGETAIEMDPKSIEAHMLLGGLYSGLKMYDPAREQFAAVLKTDPTDGEAAVYMGALLAEEKKYDEAISYFEGLAKNKDFNQPEKAFYYIGQVRSAEGDDHLGEAEKAFSKALSIKPEYPEAALNLALLYHAQGKDTAMVNVLKSYQEKFGPDHEMARNLAHYYLEKEEYPAALEQLEVVDSFEHDNLNIKIQIALILIELKKYEAAATRLEDILVQAPDSDKVRYYLGAVYEEINRPQLALSHYAKIPPSSTYFPEAVVHSAQMLKVDHRTDEAVSLVEKAIREQDDVPQLYAYYATLLDEKKAYSKAVKMLTAAVAKFPSNTQLRFFLGTMQDHVGNRQETISQMRKVIEMDKDHVQALNYLAYTYAELGENLEEAGELAAHALELQPGDGYILDTMGWVHFKKGEVEEAIKYLEAAYKAKSDEAIIAEHLGDAYLRHQMWQKAQRLYQKAADLEHDSDHTRAILQKLANVKAQNQQPSRMPASLEEPRAQ